MVCALNTSISREPSLKIFLNHLMVRVDTVRIAFGSRDWWSDADLRSSLVFWSYPDPVTSLQWCRVFGNSTSAKIDKSLVSCLSWWRFGYGCGGLHKAPTMACGNPDDYYLGLVWLLLPSLHRGAGDVIKDRLWVISGLVKPSDIAAEQE